MLCLSTALCDGDTCPDRVDPRVGVSKGKRIRHKGHAEELDGGCDGQQVQLGTDLEADAKATHEGQCEERVDDQLNERRERPAEEPL